MTVLMEDGGPDVQIDSACPVDQCWRRLGGRFAGKLLWLESDARGLQRS